MDKRYHKLEISIIVLLTLAILSITRLIQGKEITANDVKYLSIIATLVYFVWLSFNSYLWRLLCKLRIIQMPDLNGEWKGTLDFYTFDNEKKSKRVVDIKILIKQTFRSVSVAYKGVDNNKCTKSNSMTSGITNINGDYFKLIYTFEKNISSDDNIGSGFAELNINENENSIISMSGWWLADPKSPSGGKIKVKLVEKKSLLPWK